MSFSIFYSEWDQCLYSTHKVTHSKTTKLLMNITYESYYEGCSCSAIFHSLNFGRYLDVRRMLNLGIDVGLGSVMQYNKVCRYSQCQSVIGV